jgi:hypothetical protein
MTWFGTRWKLIDSTSLSTKIHLKKRPWLVPTLVPISCERRLRVGDFQSLTVSTNMGKRLILDALTSSAHNA